MHPRALFLVVSLALCAPAAHAQTLEETTRWLSRYLTEEHLEGADWRNRVSGSFAAGGCTLVLTERSRTGEFLWGYEIDFGGIDPERVGPAVFRGSVLLVGLPGRLPFQHPVVRVRPGPGGEPRRERRRLTSVRFRDPRVAGRAMNAFRHLARLCSPENEPF